MSATQARPTTQFHIGASSLGGPLPRRRFLQSAGAVGAASLLPLGFSDIAAGASPIGAKDGILILITMHGGCDGLDMVVPISNTSYYEARGSLAMPAASTLPIDASRGLHPELTAVKAAWDRGNVAIIEGAGDPNGTLSHFENKARIMAARTGEGPRTSGWLGRYIDGLSLNPSAIHGVSFGGNVPLVAQGNQSNALALEASGSKMLNRSDVSEIDRRQIDGMSGFGSSSLGRGALADIVAGAGKTAVNLGQKMAPLYENDVPEGDLVSQMVMTARIINANLGVRVFTLNYGDFDGHADHRRHLDEGLRELNEGIEAFNAALNYDYVDRVMTLAVTEFGRRPRPNNSGGTDHGTSATYLAIGSQMKGGVYGHAPSITDLDQHNNLKIQLDYRAVFGTVLDRWLDADSTQILGANYEDLNFTHAPATIDPGPNPAFATGLERRNEVIRLYLAYFGRLPDAAGMDYWVGKRVQGAAIETISNSFAASPEFQRAYGQLSDKAFVELIYRNVMNRTADQSGLDYWSSELGRGKARGQVMTGFSNSVEYRENTASQIDRFDQVGPVARLYQAYFLRAPERQGRDYWNSTGKSLDSISQAFSESAEFVGRYGSLSNADFVSLIYRNVLQRSAEGEGYNYWSARLESGTSRGALMVQFSESTEFVEAFTKAAG